MARLRLAAVALYCCIALSTAAGRTLQQSWDEALKQSLQVVDQAAGQVFGQVADGVAASGVVDHSVPPALQNKTIDGINRYAPVFKTDTGYFIRPQVCAPTPPRQLPETLLAAVPATIAPLHVYMTPRATSWLQRPCLSVDRGHFACGQVASALHNAAEGLGPVHVSWLGQTAAPPEAQQRAPAPAPVSSRRLLAVPRAAAPAAAPSAAATPAAAPSYAADGPVAAAEALVLAAWAPKGSAALADSFAKKRAEAPAGEEKGKEKKGKKKHKAAEAPLVRQCVMRMAELAMPGLQHMMQQRRCQLNMQYPNDDLCLQGVVQGTVQAAQQGAAPATSATSTLEQVRGPVRHQLCSRLLSLQAAWFAPPRPWTGQCTDVILMAVFVGLEAEED